ncbi:MAG: hypothetical protein AAB642_02910 [Patescibacteria group bacterium]
MDVLKIGKFIEHYGLSIVVVLGLAVGALAASTFYFYALKPSGGAEQPQPESSALKENILNNFTEDLKQRQDKLTELKSGPLEMRDVFR